jgi:hypothetical protein
LRDVLSKRTSRKGIDFRPQNLRHFRVLSGEEGSEHLFEDRSAHASGGPVPTCAFQ